MLGVDCSGVGFLPGPLSPRGPHSPPGRAPSALWSERGPGGALLAAWRCWPRCPARPTGPAASRRSGLPRLDSALGTRFTETASGFCKCSEVVTRAVTFMDPQDGQHRVAGLPVAYLVPPVARRVGHSRSPVRG